MLPDIVFRLDSAGYEHEQWFREVEELSKAHRLPFPYPDPVVPQIAYVTKCLDQRPRCRLCPSSHLCSR